MNTFQFKVTAIVALVSASIILVLTGTTDAAEAQTTGDSMTTKGNSVGLQEQNDFEVHKIKALSDILASDNGYGEKEVAIKSLGAMQSQPAAVALVANLMLVKSGVRMGPQMQAVIGMYPCALALVENGTNSILPVVQYIQRTDDGEARMVSSEVLRRICGTAGAMDLIESQLSVATGKEESARLKEALNTLRQ